MDVNVDIGISSSEGEKIMEEIPNNNSEFHEEMENSKN
jgi:hypothetical protein